MAITLQILSINAPYYRKHFTYAVVEKLRQYQIILPTDSYICCLAENSFQSGKVEALVYLITVNQAGLFFLPKLLLKGPYWQSELLRSHQSRDYSKNIIA